MASATATVPEPNPPLIVTIGDLILDVVVLPERPLIADADTPATIRLVAGGQAANVAAWAVALGARSRLICRRGDDAASRLAAAELSRLGVDLRGPVAEGRGGVVVSVGEEHGGRTMASDRGVAAQLAPAQLDPTWLSGCAILHVSGYALLREPLAATALAAARLAPRVTVDLASAGDISAIGVELFAGRLAALQPQIIFATEAEQTALPDFGFAGEWVIKLGPDGARFPEVAYPAPGVEVVDTTGAGDALAAGYLVGGPALAMQAAARCIGSIGAMPSGASGRPA